MSEISFSGNLIFYAGLNLYFQPNMQSRLQKEGVESEQFWDLLGGKSQYLSQKISRDAETDPHLFFCTFLNGMKNIVLIHFAF